MRRFSIAALMAVVLICGVAIAALREASDTWAGILLLLTLLLLGVSVLGAVYRREARRAFWLGFALFGWGYLVLTMGPWFAEQVQPKMPTTHLLGYTHGKLAPQPAQTYIEYLDSPSGGGDTFTGDVVGFRNPEIPDGTTTWKPLSRAVTATASVGLWSLGTPSNLDQFVRVGHCLFALLAALMGGLMARWFQRTDREAAADG